MKPSGVNSGTGRQASSGAWRVLPLVFGSALLLAGCGDRTQDPGAQRSDAVAKQLRDRIEYTQGRT